MHWGIYTIMGIVFWYHLSGLAFVPLLLDERPFAWLRIRAERAARALSATRPLDRLWPHPRPAHDPPP
jgi:hypothetical protein